VVDDNLRRQPRKKAEGMDIGGSIVLHGLASRIQGQAHKLPHR
jgi:hypothetical protein